ncbi:MAG: hypothetical protein AAB793_00645 [Patescibacteria group bacterium]
MPDKELTLEDLEADIKKLLNKEVFEKLQGKWSIYKLKCRGFGFRVFITLVEEEDPVYYIVDRKPVYRQPKIAVISNGFTGFDFDFFCKNRIFPPHEPPAEEKKACDDEFVSKIKTLVWEALDKDSGYRLQIMLKKYGTGLRIHLSAIQEDNPRLVIAGKIFKVGRKKNEFTAHDLEFLQKNKLIGF